MTSAAWNTGARLAPDSLGSGYGTGLSIQTASPTATPLPVALAGTTLSIRDSAGALRLAQMVLASPGQVNFLVPAGTAAGSAQFTLYASSGATATGSADIVAVSPSIFTLPGTSVPAAIALRVGANGSQSPVTVFECSGSNCSAAPMDLGAAGDSIVLTLFATGLRKNADLSKVRATAGGVDAQALFAGAQTEFAGLDQVNLLLPASLRGRGSVPIVLTVDGQTSNTVTINIR